MPKKKAKKGGLGNDQKKFIKSKVKKLKSLKRVEEFYNKDDNVSAYAKRVAAEMYISKKKVKK